MQLEKIRSHIKTLNQTDGLEGIERLVEKLITDLGTPSKRLVANIQKYAIFLESYFQICAVPNQAMNRIMQRLPYFQDPALLDLAAQFTVELDRVEVNLIRRTMTAEPANPNQVCDCNAISCRIRNCFSLILLHIIQLRLPVHHLVLLLY